MSDIETNKRVVVDYYQTAFDGNPEKAVADHFVKWLRSEHPQVRLEIKRVIAEGDLVATHSHLILEPGQPGRALADFFRLEDGKVVEHWDVIQDVPDKAANPNGMF
jgi:predicted SnoaL-like aldol condensation-catalyzing enzyme